jgi:hypothetical protein
MNQLLHIFKKDTRRFWPEILFTVGATLAFSLLFPARWQDDNPLYVSLLSLVTFIVPASWWLLIGRVIHAESLVGDNQFWITRPYQWKKLLAAKVVFLAVWIGVPFFAAQLLVIAEAGFHVVAFVPVVLFNLGVFAAMLLLPLVAIATVTANFARMTLTLIGGTVAVVALSFIPAFFILHNYSAWNPVQDRISLPIEFAGAILVIVLQYATRRILIARTLLIGFALLVFSVSWFYRSQVLINRAYANPVSRATSSLLVSLDPAHAPSSSVEEKKIRLTLPVIYSGVPNGSAAVVENIRFSLTATDGASWASPWMEHRATVLPNPGSDLLELTMDTATFDRFQHSPVTLHVIVAVADAQATSTANVPYPVAAAPVPGLGICFLNHGRSFLACRSVVRQTPLTYVSEVWSATGDCTPGKPDAGSVRGMWAGSLQPPLSEFNLSPISVLTLRWGGWDEGSNRPHWRACPASPLTVTQYRLVDRTTVDLLLSNFTLPPVGVVDQSK